MNLATMIKRVQAIIHDDTEIELPAVMETKDEMEVPEEYRDILVNTAAAKYMQNNGGHND